MTLVLKEHWAGFYSCCCVRLSEIIDYCMVNKISPLTIINNKSFTWYNPNKTKDIIPDFFTIINEININTEKNVKFCYGGAQYSNYIDLPLIDIVPYVKKFFSPSEKILRIKENLIKKYSIDTNNICVLFLRGNDKAKECKIPAYNIYMERAIVIQKLNPDIKFIIQSDEIEFIDCMKNVFSNNIIFYDEIRSIKKNINVSTDNKDMNLEDNYKYALNFLAIVLIMSECKFVICNSGNISLWIALFRENQSNFIQL